MFCNVLLILYCGNLTRVNGNSESVDAGYIRMHKQNDVKKKISSVEMIYCGFLLLVVSFDI